MGQYSKYQIFCKVVEKKSFTKVAEEASYSQSAVSQTVKSLETELGTALVDRKKGGIVLTKDGRDYFPFIQAISAAENALDKYAQERNGFGKSEISIGAFTSVTRTILPDLMLKFRELYPETKFMIKQGDYTTIPEWIKNGIIDFGFVSMDAETGLSGEKLYVDEMVAVLPKNHRLASQKEVSLSQLAKEKFILMDEGAFSTTLDAFRKKNIKIDPDFTLYDDYSILSMVREGLGVSMLFKNVVQEFENGIEIRQIKENPSRTIGIVWKDWDTLPAASKKFVEFCKKNQQG